MRKGLLYIFLLSLLFLFEGKGYAGYVLIDEKLYHSDELPSHTEEKHYALAVRAFELENYQEAAKQFRILAINFGSSPLSQDAWFFAGVSYYYLSDLDLSNNAISSYLCQTAPR